jgi:hypothetical protein
MELECSLGAGLEMWSGEGGGGGVVRDYWAILIRDREWAGGRGRLSGSYRIEIGLGG